MMKHIKIFPLLTHVLAWESCPDRSLQLGYFSGYNFEDGQNYCNSLGGQLAIVQDSITDSCVENLLTNQNSSAFLNAKANLISPGLNTSDPLNYQMRWQNSDKDQLYKTYYNTNFGWPNGTCLTAEKSSSNNYVWETSPCDSTNSIICSKCNPNTYNLFGCWNQCTNTTIHGSSYNNFDKNSYTYNYWEVACPDPNKLDQPVCKIDLKWGPPYCLNFNINYNISSVTSSGGSLNFMGKNIKKINSYSFDGVDRANVRVLDLSWNSGLSFDKDAFININPERIYFAKCNTGNLPVGLFNYQRRIKILNLEENNLTQLDVTLFNSTVNLQTLYLTGNALTSLPAGLFDSNPELISLYLSKNKLTYWPANLLQNNKKLGLLNLSYNNITALANNAFDNNLELKILYLYDNLLTSIPFGIFDKLVQLETLKMKNNLFFSIDNLYFQNLIAVTQIDLSGNNCIYSPQECGGTVSNYQVLKNCECH